MTLSHSLLQPDMTTPIPAVSTPWIRLPASQTARRPRPAARRQLPRWRWSKWSTLQAVVVEAGTTRLTKHDLIDHLSSGCKPTTEFRLGTEHEKLVFLAGTHDRAPYDSIAHILRGLVDRHGWEARFEDGNIVGAKSKDGASVTLEPGGQLELSSAPLYDLHATADETKRHLDQVKRLGTEVGVRFLTLGCDPTTHMASTPVMPDKRYRLLRGILPAVGSHALDTMFNSCTTQVNLDFDSETAMVDTMRLSIALQPVATALFANSPFHGGKPSGYLSWRSHVWQRTDSDRTGVIPFVFDDDFGFERYIDYVLDVPMLFVSREGEFCSAHGQSFRDFMEGRLPAAPGEFPTQKDWEAHLGSVYPEVRLKQFVEMRGADVGPLSHVLALPALWVGLVYDAESKAAALELTKDWTRDEIKTLRTKVPKAALQMAFCGGKLQTIAKRVVQLSLDGLQRRGLGEEQYLEPLLEIAESGVTRAERMLALYHGAWKGSLDPLYAGDFDFRDGDTARFTCN